MKLSIKTVVLQEMVSRSVKGASCNKLIPITSLMAIQLKDKTLRLITTDASNTLYIMHDDINGEDFYCVVQVEQFSKLISKMTSDDISLEVENGILNVTGNGSYRIELPMDENGEMITYPDPVADVKLDGELKNIDAATVKTILSTNKASLAITMETPVYTGYYVADKVITTDSYKICGLNIEVLDEPTLIAPETMNLLDVMTEEKIGVCMNEEIIEFITKDCVIYSHKMEGINDFPIVPTSRLLNEKFKSSCKVSKNDLLALLDRINLFVGVYDNKSIRLTFTEEGIDVSSKQSNGIETIKYMQSKGYKPYTCNIDIVALIQQVKSNASDSIEIQYGNENSIKMIEGNVTQVIALLGDEE